MAHALGGGGVRGDHACGEGVGRGAHEESDEEERRAAAEDSVPQKVQRCRCDQLLVVRFRSSFVRLFERERGSIMSTHTRARGDFDSWGRTTGMVVTY